MSWLLKTEPSAYSFDDLVSSGGTTWDGVTNPAAVKNLRAMKKGDTVVIYHTGAERAAVGLAVVTSPPRDDASRPRSAVVDLAPVGRLPRPVPLAQLREAAAFRGSPLLVQGRLSVVPLTDAQLRFLTRGA